MTGTDASQTDDNSPNESSEPMLQFVVVHNRQKYPFNLALSTSILDIKQLLEPLTQVPVAMQKLIYRGMLSDSTDLRALSLPNRDAKLMLVGSSQSDTNQLRASESGVSAVSGDNIPNAFSSTEESWCDQPEHKRVLERFGKPDSALVGIRNSDEMLAPDEALCGLLDKRGEALRLRIRSDKSELWLATRDITCKIPLATIHDVVSQPIKSSPEYHIMAFQLGPTPKSRYFVYWMPSQYVESVKTMLLQHKLILNSSMAAASKQLSP